MCDKDNCNDASCCGECEPWNCLEQQINDALATKEEQLQGYVDEAKDAAAESKASAEASAQSAAKSKEFRDEAEIAASTAVAAEGIVVGVANSLQDTADKLEQVADELNIAIAGIAVSSWFYTTVTENQTVIPVPTDKNAVDVQSIYIEGARQSPFRGFEFDKTAMIITLAEPLPQGLEIEIILGTYNSDNPNDFAHTLASNNGASLVGTAQGITVQQTIDELNRSFQDGGVLRSLNDTLLDKSTIPYQEYVWSGDSSTLPKVVPAGSTPATTGGVGVGAWVNVGDAALRSYLATSSGSGAVGYNFKGLGNTSHRKVNEKLDDCVSLWDFHCDSSGNVIQPGPTVDSRQYIQNAIDAIYDAGGGTLIIPTETWYLNSYGVPDKIANYGGVIHWRSRVNIHFEAGATLKLTNYFNERGYCVICGFDGNDPLTSGDLRDAMLTGNGTIDSGDNVQPIGGTLCYAVGTGKSYNVTVRDIHITGGDLTWAATLGWNGYGSNTVVDRVTVTEVKKTDVDRNVDQSLFYVGCQFSGVQNCYLRPSESGLAAKISAAVELHQSYTFCLNNQMYGFMRGVYVVLHGHETAGSSLFMNTIRVSGNTAFINGQFVTVGADNIGYNTHVSDVIISDNICSIMNPVDSAPLVRCFISSDLFVQAPPDNETARVLVDGNIFLAPTTIPDSVFFFYRVSSRSFYFSNNICDCRRMVSGDGAGTATVELRDIIWDASNKIGSTWLGLRGGDANMFEFYVANILRCKFEISMPYSDTSMASIFYAPDTANITFTVVKVAPENIPSSVTAVSISDANKNRGTNYFEFPVTTTFSSFNSSGPVFCYSTGTDYAWCGSATALSKSGISGLVTPGEYGVKDNGQLGGVGHSDTAAARNWSQRVLLKSAIS